MIYAYTLIYTAMFGHNTYFSFASLFHHLIQARAILVANLRELLVRSRVNPDQVEVVRRILVDSLGAQRLGQVVEHLVLPAVS